MLLETSSIPINLTEVAHSEDLVELLRLPTITDSVHAQWINHAVLCFIRQTLGIGKSTLTSTDARITDEASIEIPVNIDDKVESGQSSGSSGESSETLSGQEGEPVEEKLTDIASSIATNLMKAIKESVGDKKEFLKKTALKLTKPERKCSTYHIFDGFDRGFQMESNRISYESLSLVNGIMAKGLWRYRAHVEQQRAEVTYDQTRSVESHSLISSVFSELARTSINSKSLLLVVHQWIAISSVSVGCSSPPALQLPLDIAQEIASKDFNVDNKYTNYICERSMLSLVNQIQSDETASLQVLKSAFKHPSYTKTNALLLLKVFAESLSKEPHSSSSETAEETSVVVTRQCKLYLKNLILEALRQRR